MAHGMPTKCSRSGAKYPQPPDLVGVTRTYSKDVDEVVLRANQALVASIPMKYKGSIKEHLRKVGWTGFSVGGADSQQDAAGPVRELGVVLPRGAVREEPGGA